MPVEQKRWQATLSSLKASKIPDCHAAGGTQTSSRLALASGIEAAAEEAIAPGRLPGFPANLIGSGYEVANSLAFSVRRA